MLPKRHVYLVITLIIASVSCTATEPEAPPPADSPEPAPEATVDSGAAEEKAEPEAGPLFYALSASRKGISIDLRVNGFPVWVDSDVQEGSTSSALNRYLKPGTNVLTIAASASEPKKRGRRERGGSVIAGSDGASKSISVSVVSAPRGALPSDGDVIYSLELPTKTDALQLPLELEVELEAPKAPRSRIWVDAEPVKLTPSVKQELTKYTNTLITGFKKKDAKALGEQMAFKAADTKIWNHQPDDDALGQMNKMISRMVDQVDTRALRPFKASGLRFESMADGRVVHITNSKGRSPLRFESKEGYSTGIDVYVGRVSGAWTLVR
ncbi:MAG: hypothetical protein AAFU77_15640 [Myxococcota bacterium]